MAPDDIVERLREMEQQIEHFYATRITGDQGLNDDRLTTIRDARIELETRLGCDHLDGPYRRLLKEKQDTRSALFDLWRVAQGVVLESSNSDVPQPHLMRLAAIVSDLAGSDLLPQED